MTEEELLLCLTLYLAVGICTAVYALFEVQRREAQRMSLLVQEFQAELEALEEDFPYATGDKADRILALKTRIRHCSVPLWNFEFGVALLVVLFWPFFLGHKWICRFSSQIEVLWGWLSQKGDQLSTWLWSQLMRQ